MYAVCEFHLVALFSFRSLHANAFAAQTLPCPTPAGVKLALLSKLLERDGGERGQEHLDWLAPLTVGWRPPKALAITTATVRVFRPDEPDKPMVGMREYAHADTAFSLAIGPVPDDRRADLGFALGQLRALGNAESLVQPVGPPDWEDTYPEGLVDLTSEASADDERGHAVVLDDLGDAPSWERLNVYRSHDRKLIPQIGPDRIRRIVALPLSVVRWAETGYALASDGRQL